MSTEIRRLARVVVNRAADLEEVEGEAREWEALRRSMGRDLGQAVKALDVELSRPAAQPGNNRPRRAWRKRR